MSRQQRLVLRDLSSEEGVKTASGVMVERNMILEKGYRRALAKAFQAHPHQMDFTKVDQAVSIINAWVSEHTAGTYNTQLTAHHLQNSPQNSAATTINFVLHCCIPAFLVSISFETYLLSFLL